MIYIIVILAVLFIFVALVVRSRYENQKNFVEAYSESLKKLREKNIQYVFVNFINDGLVYEYDNKDVFDDMHCKDCFVYYLRDNQIHITNELKKEKDNNFKYAMYLNEVNACRNFGNYTADIGKFKIDRLKSIEETLFNKNIKTKPHGYWIRVTMYRTDLKGERFERKQQIFYSNEISSLIERINNRTLSNKYDDYFYKDEEIWKSLCKVERGKVTNKLRFQIYERDGYRCKICGRKFENENLEIDHIIPISKGGKSTMNNLQTLCHNCNQNKGNDIYWD